jgi:hypothetical protein
MLQKPCKAHSESSLLQSDPFVHLTAPLWTLCCGQFIALYVTCHGFELSMGGDLRYKDFAGRDMLSILQYQPACNVNVIFFRLCAY